MSLDVASVAVGALGTGFLYWIRRTLMPVIHVRLEASTCAENPELVRIALEVENPSEVSLKRTAAKLQVDEVDPPPAGGLHPDWQEPSGRAIDVLRAEKLEPREVLHTEVLYRWGTKPILQCRLSFEYDSWLCRLYHFGRPDQHTVVKWVVKPSS